MIRHAVLFLTVLSLVLFLSGCTGQWLEGTWEVDREATMEAFGGTRSESEQPGGFLGDVIGGVQKGVSRILVNQMEDTTIEITATEVRMTRGGTRISHTYEVVEYPSAGTVLLRYADGEEVTWNRTSAGIRRRLTPEGDIWIHYRRKR